MKTALQILPIALLLIGAGIAVWRGMDTKSDRTSNRAKGGGPIWKAWK